MMKTVERSGILHGRILVIAVAVVACSTEPGGAPERPDATEATLGSGGDGSPTDAGGSLGNDGGQGGDVGGETTAATEDTSGGNGDDESEEATDTLTPWDCSPGETICVSSAKQALCVDGFWQESDCSGPFGCSDDACQCEEPWLVCDGACINPATDEVYCGSDEQCSTVRACEPDAQLCWRGGCMTPLPECLGELRFASVALAGEVARAAGQIDQKLTFDDVAGIEAFRLVPDVITALDGLQCLHYLRAIELENAQVIADLSPIGQLQYLQEFIAEGERGEAPPIDLAGLAGATRLSQFSVRDHAIVNLSGIGYMPELEALSMIDSRLTSLVGAEDWSSLEQLNLLGTSLADLTGIGAAPELEELILHLTDVADITPLAALSKLAALDLGHSPVVDLRPLERLTELRELRINHTLVADLTPILSLEGLEWLDAEQLPNLDCDAQKEVISDIYRLVWGNGGDAKLPPRCL